MKIKKIYYAKPFYSLYMGMIMGFIIASGFFVIIVNLDRYFLDSVLGVSGNIAYYLGTVLLIPIFGAIYVHNKRIDIDNNKLRIRENGFSNNISEMDIISMKSISLHERKRKKRDKRGIKFADGETGLLLNIRPYSKKTLSKLIKRICSINSNIVLDDYCNKLMNDN